MSQSRSKLKWSIVIVAALLVLFLLTIRFGVPEKPKYPQVALKDGRIVQLAAVTVGPSHSIKSSALRNILFNFMPAGFKKQFGPTYNASFGFQYNGIGLWLLCYDPALDQYVAGAIDKVVVVDAHGCELESTGSAGTSDGVHHATIFNLSNFPRDLDQITCHLFARGSSNALGQITISNPVKTAAIQWSPQAFPISVTNGNISVRLHALPGPNTASKYVVFKNGEATTEWSMQEMHFEDAFGNAGPNLCPKQSAWKLKTRFSRNETAVFSSNELWRLPPIKFPAPGVCTTFNLTNRIGADEVVLRHIVGPGSYTFSNGVVVSSAPWRNGMGGEFGVTSIRGPGRSYIPVTTRAQNDTAVIIAHAPFSGLRETLVRAWSTDRLVGVSGTGNRDGSASYFDLNWRLEPNEGLPTNAPLDLELIIQEALEFEFLVSPPDAIQTSRLVVP